MSFSTQAQNPVIKHYSVNQGLPSSECYWSIQDSKGYLWISTDAGVVKYDGYKFITYNSAKGLPDNTVFKIHEDKYGKIWFATYSGKMAYYSYQTDSIYEIKANKELSEIGSSFPVDFAFDENDTLYISLDRIGYLKAFPPAYEKLQRYFPEGYNQFYFIKKINQTDFVCGIISPLGKFLRFNGQGNPTPYDIPLIYDEAGSSDVFEKDTIYKLLGLISHLSIIKLSDTSFLFSNSRAVVYISGNCKKNIIQGKKDNDKNHIISIFKDKKERIWVSKLNGGVVVYNDASLTKELYHFLGNVSVTSVYQDTDNGFWITTLVDGIYYIPSLGFSFIDQNSGLSSNKVLSIALIKKNLYCLTADFTLNKFELLSQKKIGSEKLLYSAWYLAQSDSSLLVCQSIPYISSLGTDQKIYPWIITNGKKRTIKFKKAINYKKDYFLGFDGGLIILGNKKTGECKIIVSGLPTTFSIQFQNNTIWIGTKLGLYSYNNNLLHFQGKDDAILKNRVEDMLVVGDTLFLATRGYGVLCMLENKIIKHYTEKDGLASNMTKCIIKDKLGNIWIGTNRGISRLKKTGYGTYSLSALNMSSGLVSNEVNEIIEYEQKLYFATNSGLGILNIADFYNPDVSIPVYIEGFSVNNIKLSFSGSHLFDYKENFISIIYKGVCVKSEGEINYKYRLEGLDTNWTYSKNTYVQFTTLPHGEYKFVVYAINQDGKLSEHPATIFFIIQKPFWKAWWFYLLTALVIFTIIYLLYNSRVRFIKQQEKEKTESNKRITESELKALRAQMNPHFMFNAINSIQNFVLKNDSRSAQKYLTKFARLIRSVLENSKHELVWLSKEVEALELYMELEALRASFSFDYEIIMDDSLNAANLFIPPMIIQPYIENAILHGIIPLTERRGKLLIKFSQEGFVLKCVIDDNGIGRTLAEEIRLRKQYSHQSMGMNVTRDRITILNQHTNNMLTSVIVLDKIIDQVAMGTRVEISINMKKSQND